MYSYFRYQMHRAMENARVVYSETVDDFERLFHRRYGAVEAYCLDDADTVIVMTGSFATKGKAAVNAWREQGHRIGLLRLHMIRPLPATEIIDALSGRNAVAVIDQNISPGLGGILFHEVAAVLATSVKRPRVLRSFIGGLGGKDISQVEFDRVLEVLEHGDPDVAIVEPELLITHDEHAFIRNRLETAGKAFEEVGA